MVKITTGGIRCTEATLKDAVSDEEQPVLQIVKKIIRRNVEKNRKFTKTYQSYIVYIFGPCFWSLTVDKRPTILYVLEQNAQDTQPDSVRNALPLLNIYKYIEHEVITWYSCADGGSNNNNNTVDTTKKSFVSLLLDIREEPRPHEATPFISRTLRNKTRHLFSFRLALCVHSHRYHM